MVISEVETSTVSVSPSNIPEASLMGRKPVELEKPDLLFWQLFKRHCENTACKTIAFL